MSVYSADVGCGNGDACAFSDQTLRVLFWRTADGGYVQYLYLGRKR